MSDFNKMYLMGNLVQDPELINIGSSNKVVKFTVAVNRQWTGPEGEESKEVSYIDCVAYGKRAEVIDRYFSKGRKILVDGRLKQEKWEDKITKKMQSRIRVVVENFHFVDSKKDVVETIPAVAGNEDTGDSSSIADEDFDVL